MHLVNQSSHSQSLDKSESSKEGENFVDLINMLYRVQSLSLNMDPSKREILGVNTQSNITFIIFASKKSNKKDV